MAFFLLKYLHLRGKDKKKDRETDGTVRRRGRMEKRTERKDGKHQTATNGDERGEIESEGLREERIQGNDWMMTQP